MQNGKKFLTKTILSIEFCTVLYHPFHGYFEVQLGFDQENFVSNLQENTFSKDQMMVLSSDKGLNHFSCVGISFSSSVGRMTF